MGNDGEAEVDLVSCPVNIGELAQNSTNWSVVKGTCEYRWSAQCSIF
jgi:hypothetical protein